MRSNLQTILAGILAVALTVNPAMACHYWGCGEVEVYVEPCGSCGGPCEAVEVVPEGPCCSIGQPSAPGSMGPPMMSPETEMPAPQQPAQSRMNGGGEMLAPPEVPDTHAGKPLEFEQPPAQPEPETESGTSDMGADELFGTPSAEPSDAGNLFAPSAPAGEEAVEVIEETTTEPADAGGIDSLFGEPVEQPAEQPAAEPSAPADSGGFDSLFGEPAPAESTEPAAPPEEATPVEEENESDSGFDNLFGQTDKVLQETGGLESTGLRRWMDNTGEYSCQARLIDVQDGHVKLLKNNGRTTTVPLARLSRADLDFVNRQASAHRTASSDRTAHILPSWPAE